MKPLSKTTLQLHEVRRHIENGWCQRRYVDLAGNVCIWGAVYRVADSDAEVVDIGCALERVLARRPWLGNSLMRFNDSSTKEEVLALVQEAIEAGG